MLSQGCKYLWTLGALGLGIGFELGTCCVEGRGSFKVPEQHTNADWTIVATAPAALKNYIDQLS